jgi:hypothetical protein
MKKLMVFLLFLVTAVGINAQDYREFSSRNEGIEQNDKNIAIHKKSALDNNCPVIILLYRTSGPNSAGEVDCGIWFMNVSEKRIKYAYFTVVPYNKVDDIAFSKIGNESKTTLQHIGFVKPDDWEISEWDDVWYNSTIAYSKITGIRVVFDDNSEQTIDDEKIISAVTFSKDEFTLFRSLQM